MNQGVDISNNNTITNFATLRQFTNIIIHKATGATATSGGTTYIDSKLRSNYPSMVANNFKIGYYHFLANNSKPEDQAQHFLDTISELRSDTVLWLDIEGEEYWNKQAAVSYANAFINYLVAKGHKTGIYTGLSFYNDYLKGNIPNNSVWWLASYPNQPAYYPFSASWQYSESGKPNGTNGSIDLDYFLDDIFVNGTVTQQATQPILVPLPSNFCEAYYLKMNPDVASAVIKGIYKSGADHYQQCGYKEGRKFSVPIPTNFNDAYYLQENNDIELAVEKGAYKNGLAHYLQYGWNENRKCVPQETISYAGFVQNVGLQNAVSFNQIAGTVGRGFRLEGLTIDYNGIGTLTLQGYTQDTGWQPVVGNGMLCGTINQSKRLEAIKIFLYGSSMILSYQVQVENIGWMDYVKNSELAGTTGKALRIEAIRIKLE